MLIIPGSLQQGLGTRPGAPWVAISGVYKGCVYHVYVVWAYEPTSLWFFLTLLSALSCVISVSNDEVSDLIQENNINKQLMDSFKDLLTETVGQIKSSR